MQRPHKRMVSATVVLMVLVIILVHEIVVHSFLLGPSRPTSPSLASAYLSRLDGITAVYRGEVPSKRIWMRKSGAITRLWSEVDPDKGEDALVNSAEDKQSEEEEERRARAVELFQVELEKEKANSMDSLKEELKKEKKNKIFTAVGSVFSAVALFFYQHLHPVEAVTLLRQMQQESPKIQSVLSNGRPTVIDFYAEWCENCKEMAPILREVEGKYKDRVNFVVINGDSQQSSDLVDLFRVDGIPHLALISKEGEVKTALIGKVPKQVIEADIDSLLAGKLLPYEGYDAFEDDNHFVRLD